jgi:dihydroflavonol-4-reductase
VSTVLVTGATGLTGANVCRQLVERGDRARALVRPGADSAPLAELGVELVTGDVTDAEQVQLAAKGGDAAIHCAALLGGASQDLADFRAVNVDGTRHVLDAAQAVGMRRVVALSTGTFFDRTASAAREEAPLSEEPSDDPYTITKRAAFLDAMDRAAAGHDVVTAHPGAIFGPSPVPSRALGRTSFNRVLLAALRGRLTRYLRFPVSWVLADDVARGCLAALDHGVSGERYMLDGRADDVTSTADCCNQICELAGLGHRVEDVAVSDDPELVATFGPTLVAIAAAEQQVERGEDRSTKTYQRLGYVPTPLPDGLALLLDWLRSLGRLD